MRYSRSHRRHHRERLINKRRKEVLQSRTISRQDHLWVEKTVRRRVHTAASCSCWMCGNPRYRYGNSRAALSRQELKADLWVLDLPS